MTDKQDAHVQACAEFAAQNDSADIDRQQAARDPVEGAYWWGLLDQIEDKKRELSKSTDDQLNPALQASLDLLQAKCAAKTMEQFTATQPRAVPDAPPIEWEAVPLPGSYRPPPVADTAPPEPQAAAVGDGWAIKRPQRFQGYGNPLFKLLTAAHVGRRPIPTAREVIDAWAAQRPPEVIEATGDTLKYYDAKGNTKAADLDAIRQAINRMID